jgi:methyl-accepting chemotaxis protein
MDFINQLTIRQRLLVLTILTIFAIFFMSAWVINFSSKNLDLSKTSTNVETLKANMLMLRRNEKDFILRKDLKYLKKFEKNFAVFQSTSKELKSLLGDDTKLKEELKGLNGFSLKYKKEFIEFVQLQKTIGLNEKVGLYGSLRNSVHKLQDIAKKSNNDKLLSMVYDLRKQEKDFMLRRNLKYVDKLKKKVKKLANNKELIFGERVTHLDNYTNDFLKLVEAEKKIGLTHKEGLQGTLRNTIHKTEKSLNSMSKHISEMIKQREEELLVQILLIVVVFLVLFAMVVYFISSTIKKSLDSSLCVIQDSTEHLQSISSLLSKDSSMLSNMSASQSASIEEISANIEQTTSNINMNFDVVSNLENIGKDVNSSANLGYQYMEKLSNSMTEISTSSTEINSIVETIDQIAFQTNLLALNAAVEAARAGEHGLGFAVVSEEVRNLATRSAEESTKIRKVIENAVLQSQMGIDITNQTNDAFKDILSKISSTIEFIDKLSISSKEQKESIEQLRLAIVEVDGVTSNLAQSSDKISSMSVELDSQIENSNNTIKEISKLI